MDYSKYIRVIEGFPTKEISFKDISPLLANPEAFRSAIKERASYVKEWGADAIIGPESRGFIFGCPVALEANVSFIMARKQGKLPGSTIAKEFTLEYGKAVIELPEFLMKPGMRIVLIDDLMATGGTLKAMKELIEENGSKVVGIISLIELTDLKGRDLFKDTPVVTFMKVPH